MSEIITYSNSPSGKYCQIKFDDGKRILISLTQAEIKIFKMKFFGGIPSDTIFEITTLDLFSKKYKKARERLTEKSMALDMLDVFKEILIECHTLEEAIKTLESIFQENKQDEPNGNMEELDESIEEQLAELSKEHPLLVKMASAGVDCDMLPNVKGDFGYFPSNPIPVNGANGEIKYLARLRCADNSGILFHRLETIDMENIDGSVDIFETVCIDGKHWSILCLNMYHPRRSRIAPKDYSFSSYHPIYSKQGVAWGTTNHDKLFPFGLGTFIEQRLGVAFAKKYEEAMENKGKFKKPEEHKKLVEDLLFAVRRVKKEPSSND